MRICCECPLPVYETNIDVLPPDVTLEMLKEVDMNYEEYYEDDCRVGWFLSDDDYFDSDIMEEFEIHPSESEWFDEELGHYPDGHIIYVWYQRGGLYTYKDDPFPEFSGHPKNGDLMIKRNGRYIPI